MINKSKTSPNLPSSISKMIIVMGLSALGVISGFIPQYNSHNHQLSRENHLLAQNISNDQLRQYAQAAVEIERLRQITFNKVENIVGKGQTNQLACHQQDSINQLSEDARLIVTDYCQTSENIVKKHGLTINQFNQITQQVRQNEELKNRLQQITRQL